MKLEKLHTSVIVIDCAHFIKIVVLITGQGKFKLIVFVMSEKIAKNHRNTTGWGERAAGELVGEEWVVPPMFRQEKSNLTTTSFVRSRALTSKKHLAVTGELQA